MQNKLKKTLLAGALSSLFAVAAGGTHAAGFALIEQSGSGMGNAFAGAAAVAEDASTVYFNPAGMSLLEGSQFAVAGHVIAVSSKFSGTATNPLALGGGAATGGNGGDAGETAVVPNGYIVMPVSDRMHFGVGVSVPFGLATEYDADWIGRFQGVRSELATLNINPSVSYKASDTISIGGGVNYQLADAELTNAVVLGPGLTGKTKLEADDDGWGWNLGVLIKLAPSTRIGVSYRSEIDYDLEGSVTTTADATGTVVGVASGASHAEVTFPDMLSLSVAHDVSDRLQLLADVTQTGWSSINEIKVINSTTGGTRDVLEFDFDDAMRYSIGANYRWSDAWMLKAGVAFDETPVKAADSRTVRLPDSDRTWISIGGQVRLGSNGRLDLGYSHLFIDDADINFTKTPLPPLGAAGATTVTGTYEGSVDIFSVQYSQSF